MAEQWKAVVGYEGLYEVSDRGRVRSLDRVVARGKDRYFWRGRVMRLVRSVGYWSVRLSKRGVVEARMAHVLVLEAFVGPRPKGHQGCHQDGDPSNSRLENLAWKTVSANSLDRRVHGTMPRGETSGLSTLTEKKVRRIRKLVEGGMAQQRVADRFKIRQSTVSKIVMRQRWAHI